MTHRVKKSTLPDTGTLYQLPAGNLWWCCRYIDGDRVSETLFTHQGIATWFGANATAQIELQNLFGRVPEYQVTLHAPNE